MSKSPPMNPKHRVSDPASAELLDKAQRDGTSTCFSRFDEQGNQCKFGKSGLCCRLCHMGPCRISPKTQRGVCGADADTIVARNYLREIAGGAAAHSDHGRHLVLLLRKVANGEGGGYAIKDEQALRRTARLYGIDHTDKSPTADPLPRSCNPPGNLAAAQRPARGNRPHDRGEHAPNHHGGGSRLPKHFNARISHRAVGRLGGVPHRHHGE